VHSCQKLAFGLFGLEELGEDWAFHVKRLHPARRAFADRILQVAPKRVELPIRVEDVARHGARAGTTQIGRSHRRAGVRFVLLVEKAQTGAGVEQALESVGVGANLRGQSCGVCPSLSKAVEDPE
jgi:hypothetical protein